MIISVCEEEDHIAQWVVAFWSNERTVWNVTVQRSHLEEITQIVIDVCVSESYPRLLLLLFKDMKGAAEVGPS